MKLNERIADLRRKNKLTQQRVADYLGISRGAYANYETGAREPDAESLAKLADLFGVTVDALLGRTDDPTPPSQAKGVVSDYSLFLRAIKEKYPGVNIDDPDVQRKLMRAIDLVLEDYLENKKRKQ